LAEKLTSKVLTFKPTYARPGDDVPVLRDNDDYGYDCNDDDSCDDSARNEHVHDNGHVNDAWVDAVGDARPDGEATAVAAGG
jgi:hypothetical protein